ncbi:MAG: DEAD/DEAH box helicase [Opitutia bacterium]
MGADRIILPDLWQQDALRSLRLGRDVVLQAPTGAGKTHVFELLVEGGHRGQAVYTVPTRALANDKRAEWSAAGWDVGIATGDLAENLGAPVVVATLETQRQRFLDGRGPDLLVIDEFQMLADPRRGSSYETVLAMAGKGTQLLLMSGSVGNPAAVADWLRGLGRKVDLIVETVRPVPLEEASLDALEVGEVPGARGSVARAVIRAVLADLGPVLVFAPRRKAAEHLADAIAAGLPLGCGPELSPSQRSLAGDRLTRLLRQGVGLHHSGLTYAQRAELVEPWAKTGRLKVVVATTGLASGINFSLRSVLVTDRRYVSENAEREIRPDELLQMFGRAGRRGLDERGYALWTGDSPRLGEARALQLRRAEGLDWPAFLCLMRKSDDPVGAAVGFSRALFTKEPPNLALDRLEEMEDPSTTVSEGPLRRIREIKGLDGTWQRERPTVRTPVSQALYRVKDGWHPATSKPDAIRHIQHGTPCRLDDGTGAPLYGRAVTLAHFPKDKDASRLVPAEWLTKALRGLDGGRERRRDWRLESLESEILPLLPKLTDGGMPFGPPFIGKDSVRIMLDYSRTVMDAFPDASGAPLLNPERREVEKRDIVLAEALGGTTMRAALAGRLWRRLGLIDPQGRPTRRGEVASLFLHGDGLAVAAAREDDGYDAEELAWDLAELRAGERLGASGRISSRLGALCRLTYRSLTAEGYLRDGLPAGFGEGCAESLRAYALHGKLPHRPDDADSGDYERAALEWRSTLKLIAQGPDHPWTRWQALKRAAYNVLLSLDAAARPKVSAS